MVELSGDVPDGVTDNGQRLILPCDVLEVVVDAIVGSAGPFASVPTWGYKIHWTISTLKAMSLVHSSWRSCAQRGLQRRVLIFDESHFLTFAQNSTCRTLRKFSYVQRVAPGLRRSRLRGTTESPVAEALTAILRRATNLDFFVCSHAKLYGRYEFLDVLKLRTSLRGLSLQPSVESDIPVFPFGPLCLILPDLVRLEYLSIRGPSLSDSDLKLQLPMLSGTTPPVTLKTVDIEFCLHDWGLDGIDGWEFKAVSWLLGPRDGFSIDNLKVKGFLVRYLAARGDLVASLTSLFLDCSFCWFANDIASSSRAIGEKCTALQRLYMKIPFELLCAPHYLISSPLSSFLTIEEYNVGFGTTDQYNPHTGSDLERWADLQKKEKLPEDTYESQPLDSQLQALLSVSSHPSLRRMLINLSGENEGTSLSSFVQAFSLTTDACKRANFDLSGNSELQSCFYLRAMNAIEDNFLSSL